MVKETKHLKFAEPKITREGGLNDTRGICAELPDLVVQHLATSRNEHRAIEGATIFIDAAPRSAETPAKSATPNGISNGTSVNDFGGTGGFIGAITGGITLSIVLGIMVEPGAWFGGLVGGLFGGGIVGAAIGYGVGSFLWSIGAYADNATCDKCGRQVNLESAFCYRCQTAAKLPLASGPEELTPSDHAFLKMMTRKNRSSCGNEWVQANAPTPVQAGRFLAMALLAKEQAGVIRLEMDKHRLVAVAQGAEAEWPDHSLEAQLRRSGRVSEIMFDWMATDSENPMGSVVERIMRSMENRALLERERRWVLNRFVMVAPNHMMPERTKAKVDQTSFSLLQECNDARPDVYRHLMQDIDSAFERRTEPPSNDGD